MSTEQTPGGDQRVSVINEPGLYSLILRSRKPRAREFKRWITHEVLPTIRKTGGAYVTPGSKAEIDLADPDTYLDHLERVTSIARELRAANQEMAPRAIAATATESRSNGLPVVQRSRRRVRLGPRDCKSSS